MVASPVVGVFEARGTIFNFQYAIADSAISPLTMTGGGGRVHIHPQSHLYVVGPTSVEVAHVSRGLRGHPCQSIHGPHKFFKAWLLLRFRFLVTQVQFLALVRDSAPPPLSSGPFSFLLPASCSRWSGEWPCIAGWYDWLAFGVGVINSLIGWLISGLHHAEESQVPRFDPQNVDKRGPRRPISFPKNRYSCHRRRGLFTRAVL